MQVFTRGGAVALPVGVVGVVPAPHVDVLVAARALVHLHHADQPTHPCSPLFGKKIG